MLSKFKEVNAFAKKTSAKRTIYTKYTVTSGANLIVSMTDNTSLTPNTATTISLFFGILMALSIVFISGYWGMFMAAIFYHLRLMWDLVDGTLARRKNMTSEKGSWWDQVVGKICSLLLIASIMIRVYPHNFWLGLIIFILFLYSSHRLFTGGINPYPTMEILVKKNSFLANLYFEISRYHIFAVPFLLINKPIWVIYGFGVVEIIWIIKTIICILRNLLKK